MKDIITLCLAVFFMAGLQDTQAQSKEETIEWIKEKLESSTDFSNGKYLSKLNIKSITECAITYTYSNLGVVHLEETFPVKNVTINKNGFLNYPAEAVIAKDLTHGGQYSKVTPNFP